MVSDKKGFDMVSQKRICEFKMANTYYFVSMEDMEGWLSFYVLSDAKYNLITQVTHPETKTETELVYSIRHKGPNIFDCLAHVPLEAPTLVIGHSFCKYIFWSGHQPHGKRRQRRKVDLWEDVLENRPQLTLYTCYRDFLSQQPIDCILLPGWDEHGRPGNYVVPGNKAGFCANRRYLRLLGKLWGRSRDQQHGQVVERYHLKNLSTIKTQYETQIGAPWRKYIIKSQLAITFQPIPIL